MIRTRQWIMDNFMALAQEKPLNKITVAQIVGRLSLIHILKKDHPDHGVIFIGPCLAKKQEAMESFTAVDYVLTFEEVAAMMIAKHINPAEVEAKEEDYPSIFGRNFAQGGGVGKAVAQVAKEKAMAAPVGVCLLYTSRCV